MSQLVINAGRTGDVRREHSERTGTDVRFEGAVYFQAQRILGLQLPNQARTRWRVSPILGGRIPTQCNAPRMKSAAEHGSVNRTSPRPSFLRKLPDHPIHRSGIVLAASLEHPVFQQGA